MLRCSPLLIILAIPPTRRSPHGKFACAAVLASADVPPESWMFTTLRDWCCERGAEWNTALEARDGERGRGVFAMAPIKEGELLLRLPASLIIQPTGPMAQLVASGECSKLLGLTLAHMHESRVAEPRSPYFADLAAQPPPNMPLRWKEVIDAPSPLHRPDPLHQPAPLTRPHVYQPCVAAHHPPPRRTGRPTWLSCSAPRSCHEAAAPPTPRRPPRRTSKRRCYRPCVPRARRGCRRRCTSAQPSSCLSRGSSRARCWAASPTSMAPPASGRTSARMRPAPLHATATACSCCRSST